MNRRCFLRGRRRSRRRRSRRKNRRKDYIDLMADLNHFFPPRSLCFTEVFGRLIRNWSPTFVCLFLSGSFSFLLDFPVFILWQFRVFLLLHLHLHLVLVSFQANFLLRPTPPPPVSAGVVFVYLIAWRIFLISGCFDPLSRFFTFGPR